MQLTVVPASSQVCQVALRALLAQHSSHKVVGIYRDLGKVPSDLKSHPNFRAIRGNLAEAETIDLTGSDAVLFTTPAAFASPDVSAHNNLITDNVRNAVKKAGSVKRLVYVSSVGAQYHEGVGEVKSNYESERAYCGVAPEVVFVRNSYFMDNWRPAIDTVKSERPFFFSPILPMDFKIPMVSPQDIGEICATELLATGDGTREYPQIINVQGPERYSTKDVKDALESIVGKGVEVRPVDKDALPSFFGQVLPSHLVPEFVEMTTSMLPGGVLEIESAAITDWRVGKESLVAALTRMWHE
ncbi:hypothetical protein CGLO_10492 [Colletotrichum gloeosporioides Cg-14]|uniref:NAD(P)-binding domain-containing protein n=1 Tax=Colletotrichum gloeosporioides (strain Cg-14) TaxID=1237896 RepID=T0KDE3_COLGC|nr:hypothetical protein CGLO_10492 [Colletotrichum gloeosporioides Cg-14]